MHLQWTIAKQMTYITLLLSLLNKCHPKDAILFKFLCNQKVIPAVRYKYIRDNSKAGDFLSDSIISNSPIDLNSTEISLNNLERIGLLKLT